MRIEYLKLNICGVGFVGAITLLGGCALVPTERQRSESVKSAEVMGSSRDLVIRRVLETGPELAFRWPAETNGVVSRGLREELRVESREKQSAGSKDSAQGSSEVSIPLGWKIAMMGVGLMVLVIGLKGLSSYLKGTGFGAAVSYADGLLANYVASRRSHAMVSTDPGELARLNAQIGELEALRGRLASRKK